MKTDRSNENRQDGNTTMDPRVLSAYLFLIFVVVFYFVFRGRGSSTVEAEATITPQPLTATDTISFPSATVKPENTELPDFTSTPVTDESNYEFFAGFTNDPEVPFMLIHKSGEFMGLTIENDTRVKEVIWHNPNGQSAVIYTNKDGLPQKAVVGEYIVKYSNYTRETVDLTIIDKNGVRELLRVEHQIERFSNENTRVPQNFNVISYNNRQDSLDTQALIDDVLFAAGIASCYGAATGLGVLSGGALATLAFMCAGPLIHNEIILREASGDDIGNLEQFETFADTASCAFEFYKLQKIGSCIELAISIANDNLNYANIFQVPDVVIPPTKSVQKYP